MRSALLIAAALLAGCATKEFYLQAAEAPWEAQGVASVNVPTFQSDPAAWALADRARQAIADALDKGTVRVVREDPRTASLQGAVSRFFEQATPAAPRRILRTTGSSNVQTPLGTMIDTYAWEMDVTHTVQIGVTVRLVTAGGTAVWSKEAMGEAIETQAVPINWPGSDPVPPPTQAAPPPNPALTQRLRDRAMAQALEPLLTALTVRYAYRELR